MMKNRDELTASRQAALAAKEAFQSRYNAELSDCAVGLGLNSTHDDWVVKVYAHSLEVEAHLPDHFGPFAIDVEVSGKASAL